MSTQPLFIQQCEALIKTLETVKRKEDTRLRMQDWVDTINDSLDATNPAHFCGTAACICGYQALSHDLTKFETANDSFIAALPVLQGAMEHTREGYYMDIAVEVSRDFIKAATELLGNYGEELATSVFGGSYDERLEAAKDSGMVAQVDLSHPHLVKDDPKIEDAIDYLKLVIRICNEQLAPTS